MEAKILNEIITCLPKGKTHFRYFQDAYVVKMLSMLLPGKTSLRKIKQSPYSQFLKSPAIKPVIAKCGDGYLRRASIEDIWSEPSLPFLLSLDSWEGKGYSGRYQTSRIGKNLVLQLNLPQHLIRKYRRWVGDEFEGTFNGEWTLHPVQKPRNNPIFRETLAWSRIDIDFDHNEALIEEIQSDAVQKVNNRVKYCNASNSKDIKLRDTYIKEFKHYKNNWMQAILCATIWFIYRELGISRIYMHTARSGYKVKHMGNYSHPPVSVYSKLPKQFAFKQTWAAPQLLLETRKYQKLIRKEPDINFYCLDMGYFKHEDQPNAST